MSKLQTLLLQILVCVVLGIIMGTAFWWYDGGRTCKKVSDCPGGVVKVYRGKWHKNYLEVIK